MFKWLKTQFSKMGVAIKEFFKKDILYILSFICIYVAPIMLFAEITPYLKEYSAGIKVTFAGTLAGVIFLLIAKGKIKESLLQKRKSAKRAIWLGLNTALNWVIFVGVFYVITTLSQAIYDTWLNCGYFIGAGILFNIAYEYKVKKLGE